MSTILLPYTHHCFVCGADNPAGLQLRFRVEAGEVRAEFRPKPQHTGYQDVVHGGIIASTLDEAMFWAAAFARKQFFVSVAINLRYLKMVTAADSYQLVARVTELKRKFAFTEAELRNAAGEPCAAATGQFFQLSTGAVPLHVEDFCTDPQTLSAMEFFAPAR